MEFTGAKLALFLGAELLVIERDDNSEIPFAGYWDFPGGGREGEETPIECVLRETLEETGLALDESDLIWSRQYGQSWFFVALLDPSRVNEVRFGGEGQGWRSMPAVEYLDHPLAIPSFANRLSDYLSQNFAC